MAARTRSEVKTIPASMSSGVLANTEPPGMSAQAVCVLRELRGNLATEERYGNDGDDGYERDQDAVFGQGSALIVTNELPQKPIRLIHRYFIL
jgi:hypothetical protein